MAECRERWTYFVCPMRYGVAARTPPSPWMGPPPWAAAPDGPPPAWAAPPYHQMPQMPHGPGPADDLRRVVEDLAHHVQSLKESIDRLNPPVPRVTHDDAATSPAPAPPPAPSLPSPSVFGRGLADYGLPLPSPTGSPYVFAPRELEGIFLPPPEGGAALRGTPSRV